jgi:quinol monooxygenase YgiN
MAVKRGILLQLEAKPGKGDAVGQFLEAGRELAAAEGGTVTWYAFRIDATHFGVFDTFEDDAGRQAHLEGEIPKALASITEELLAAEPDLRPVDVLAVK